MQNSVIISQHVINTIKSLPDTDRKAIAYAMATEILLNENPCENLSGFQSMIYTMIKFYVDRDTQRHSSDCQSRLCAG